MGNHRLPLLFFLPSAAFIIASCMSGWSGIGVQAFAFGHFGPIVHAPTQSFRLPAGSISITQQQSTVRSLSNKNNNDNNDGDNDLFDLGFLIRRVERADKIEIRNDATLCGCYVLCRFLVYDVTSGAKIEPGWEIQDLIWLTGTCSSAIVLVMYYVAAGLLSRAYEADTSFAMFGPSPVVKALVNVVLCCPVWLVTEHMLGFGPPNIGGGGPAVTIAAGFLGLGSFMALAKTLTAGMR